jgi:hypothetical protein
MPETLARETPGTSYVNEVIAQTIARNPAEPEFHQAVKEVLESLAPVFDRPARVTGQRAFSNAWSSPSA